METRHDLRCFCSRKPKLAEWGRTEDGPYVHILVHKQSKVYGEVVVTSGVVEIRCRECLRWTRIAISGATGAMEIKKDRPTPVALVDA